MSAYSRLESPFPHHVLWRLVDADVDAAHVFSNEPEQEHDHAADKEQGGKHAGVTNGNFGVHKFLIDHEQACGKSDNGAKEAEVSGGAERLDRECGKAVDPEPNKTRERIAGFPFKATAVLHFYIAEALGGAENEPANVGKRIWVAHDFIDNELAHNKETRGAERLGLPNDSFGHFLVDPGAKAAEQVLPRMLVIAVNDVVAFF